MKIRPEIRPEMHGIFATRTTLYKNTLKLSYIYVNSPLPPPKKKPIKLFMKICTLLSTVQYTVEGLLNV